MVKLDLRVGSQTTLGDGSVVELLPEFRVTFGSNLTTQEPPIVGIESEAAALDIVNSRFHRAAVEPWDVNRSYSDGAYNGWISAPFYAGSAGAFAGYIEWQFRRIE